MNDPASFRDPAGIVYFENGEVRRRINAAYMPVYRKLIDSGLYKHLVQSGSLIPHRELPDRSDDSSVLNIAPRRVPLITYPYEWSFGMLREAALLTLRIHLTALNFGMCLKDASAFNVQFIGCTPVFIDTLSFEYYEDGAPWCAYAQFCRHFLAPLMLMQHTDIRLNQLFRIFPDGIPLDLADTLLHGHGGLSAWVHIHWHAKMICLHSEDNSLPGVTKKTPALSLGKHIRLVKSLYAAVEKLKYRNAHSEWGDYYAGTNYSSSAAEHKYATVEDFLKTTSACRIFDFGANDGRYTRIALKGKIEFAAAVDSDPDAVEFNYQAGRVGHENIIPLFTDLNNPPAGVGFAGEERPSLLARGKPDCIMMLALIHHLAISNNLPFRKIAEWLSRSAPNIIIEFVPKEDSQVQRLLACRKDIFDEYTLSDFEQAFCKYFQIAKKVRLQDSSRTLFLFRRNHC